MANKWWMLLPIRCERTSNVQATWSSTCVFLLFLWFLLCVQTQTRAHLNLPNRLNCYKLCGALSERWTKHKMRASRNGNQIIMIQSQITKKIRREKNLSTVRLLCSSNVFFIRFFSSWKHIFHFFSPQHSVLFLLSFCEMTNR